MIKYISSVFMLCICTQLFAQSLCNTPRYINSLFTSQVTIEPAIFATAADQNGTMQDLKFNFYEPAGDTLSKRPLIIMSFGGSFLGGSKTQVELVAYCEAMAERGFCVASIDYRIGFNIFSTDSAVRAVYRGLQDFKAAVRYFRANAAMYKIDPNHVYGGGNSAGAINAVHAAYADESDRSDPILTATYNAPDLGCGNCVGGFPMMDSEPDGVISLWGAIGDVNWIESGTDDAPIVSFHGTADNVVNINTASPFSFPIFPPLAGSNSIETQMIAQGLPNKIFRFPGQGHEVWSNATDALFIQNESAICVNDWMKPNPPVISGSNTVCNGSQSVYCPANPVVGSDYCWTVTNGTILSTVGNCAIVQWNTPGTGTVSVREQNCLDVVGNPSTLAVVITNTAAPIANFGFTYVGNGINFSNLSSGGVSYSWDFGDGTTSTIANPSYTYTTNGIYIVTLTVTNAAGCTSVFTSTVHQNCQSTLILNGTSGPTLTGLYQVYNWIESNQPLVTGANVDFKAGDYILMTNGFVAEVSNNYCATIVPCTN